MSTPSTPSTPPERSTSDWGLLNTLVVVLVVVDLIAVTWYLWQIPNDQFEHWKKAISTVAEWGSSLLAFFGIKHIVKENLSIAKALKALPVVLSIGLVTIGIWLFIVPFHRVTLYVRGSNSTPLAGVTATMDDDSGPRPGATDDQGRLKIAGLLACKHKIRLEKADYKTKELSAGFADVLGMGDLRTAPLEKAEGTVTIRTNPSGAEIYVDNEPASRGLTEKTLSLTVGKHKVTVKAPKFDARTEEVPVSAGATSVPDVWKLHASRVATYPLFIDSLPNGADIYVNGKLRGVTPGTIQLPAGQYTIKLRKDDLGIRGTLSVPQHKNFVPRGRLPKWKEP